MQLENSEEHFSRGNHEYQELMHMQNEQSELKSFSCSSPCRPYFNIMNDEIQRRRFDSLKFIRNGNLKDYDQNSSLFPSQELQSEKYSQQFSNQRYKAQDSSFLDSVLICNNAMKPDFINQIKIDKVTKEKTMLDRNSRRNQKRPSSYYESPQKERKRKPEDPTFNQSQWPKKKPKKIKKDDRLKKQSSGPHNGYSQACEKLKKCIEDYERENGANFILSQILFKDLQKNSRKSLQVIIKSQFLRQPLKHIFKSGKWLEKIRKGEAKVPQMDQNIKVVIKYQNEYFNFYQQVVKRSTKNSQSES